MRVIGYNDAGTSITYLYEGSTKNAHASGFGRSINGATKNTFVGFRTGIDSLLFDSEYAMVGNGIYFEGAKLKYSGKYFQGQKVDAMPVVD